MPSTSRIAVCSWSLRPESPADLVRKLQACGLSRVQLAFRPFVEGVWTVGEAKQVFAAAGIRVVSGMMEPLGEDYATLETIKTTGGLRPDATWSGNLDVARRCTALALMFDVGLVTFHAGFIPEEDGPSRRMMLDRIRAVDDVFASGRIRIGLETGQESADDLLAALADLGRPHVGVNFDPANMVLYGMGDPVAALRKLAPHVRQVHIKDARPATTPGAWGAEVPVGSGAVLWERFFGVLKAQGVEVAAVIEREAGDRRVEDVRTAVELVGRLSDATP